MASVSKRKWVHAGVAKEAWAVRYMDPSGVHRQRTFEKKKEADAFRSKVAADLKSGSVAADGGKKLVQESIRDFLAARQQMVRDGALARSTVQREAWHLEGHVKPHLGSRKVSELTDADADRFISALRVTKVVHAKGRTLNPVTVRQITATLASLIDYEKRRGLVAKNVVREVSQWKEHKPGGKVRVRTFDEREARAIFASIEARRPGQHKRQQAMTRATLSLAAFCGLRLGEIFGLTLANVDFPSGIIRVRHSLDRTDNLKSPKTRAGIRDVPMPPYVREAMRAWLPFMAKDKRGLIFRTSAGGYYTANNFHRGIWRPALEAADLGADEKGRRYHFHALRHFFASALVQARFSLTDTAALMGHSSFDMTLQVYAHPIVDVEWRNQAVHSMVAALLPAP